MQGMTKLIAASLSVAGMRGGPSNSGLPCQSSGGVQGSCGLAVRACWLHVGCSSQAPLPVTLDAAAVRTAAFWLFPAV